MVAAMDPLAGRASRPRQVDLAICPHCGAVFTPTPGGACPRCGYPLTAVLDRWTLPRLPPATPTLPGRRPG
jgi:predicted amidophosphoribosyltransferase